MITTEEIKRRLWDGANELLGSISQPDSVPYINELICSVDFSKATNRTADNLLRHNMTLTAKLPQWIAEIKQKYN